MSINFDHCFALCAYQVNPHLEECVQSLLAQTLKTKIIMITATPNSHIKSVAEKYGLPLHVNPSPTGMGGNWNFAYRTADTEYVTIAHEDDLYESDFAEAAAQSVQDVKNPLILFTDYYELAGGEIIRENHLLKIKRRMNAPLKIRAFGRSRFVRNRILSLGCSICCPSVTFHKSQLVDFAFDESFSCDLDWDAWSRIAKEKGSFVYIPKPLMLHRIHDQSETTRLLSNGVRFGEDLSIFKRYWPDWIARRLMEKYKKSAESNLKG